MRIESNPMMSPTKKMMYPPTTTFFLSVKSENVPANNCKMAKGNIYTKNAKDMNASEFNENRVVN